MNYQQIAKNYEIYSDKLYEKNQQQLYESQLLKEHFSQNAKEIGSPEFNDICEQLSDNQEFWKAVVVERDMGRINTIISQIIETTAPEYEEYYLEK